jgi:hypothetical protein
MAKTGTAVMYSNNREVSTPTSTTVFELLERTETVSSVLKPNPGNHRGVRLYIEVTDDGDDSPSVVFTVQVENHRTGTYYTVLTSAAITAVGNTMLEVYPDGGVTANVRANFHIGRGFRVTATHGDSDAITYGVYAEWLP